MLQDYFGLIDVDEYLHFS